jgi:hypothetical protein
MTLGVDALVGALAFMRGKERFSAPGKVGILVMRFSAGSAGLNLLKQGAITKSVCQTFSTAS